jgi:hypothetical protein
MSHLAGIPAYPVQAITILQGAFHVRWKFPFYCGVTDIAIFNFGIHMLNNFLKENVDFCAAFNVFTWGTSQILPADITFCYRGGCDSLNGSCVTSNSIRFRFTFSIGSLFCQGRFILFGLRGWLAGVLAGFFWCPSQGI